MKRNRCHWCKKLDGLIVFSDDKCLCPFCYSSFFVSVPVFPPKLPLRMPSLCIVTDDDSLDLMTAKIIAHFISRGFTISKVARQLGITRSTVYSKLKRHKLVNTKPFTPFRAYVLKDDAGSSGHYRKIIENSVKRCNNVCEKNRPV